MPIYNYLCKDCGEKFELLLGVTADKPKIVCKKCGSKNIKKEFSSFSMPNSSDGGTSGSCPTGTCPLG
ncbi:MAG: zinc ribbon domain-containing protein [Candidatus Omnitrophica bacterium]|nr:zinc ribbon domain-containing protein [Candidatus Omnitrophota bacterium]